jgi:deoxyhypusine monooxygenase
MGAISTSSSIPILQEYLSDSERTVRETCEIAIAKIEWDNSEEGQEHPKGLTQSNVPYGILSV